jgi:uncharacterized repeat protein (TIGR01451 family)
MRRSDRSRSRIGSGARFASFLVVVAAALALAGVGAAAPSGSADLKITKVDNPDPVSVGSTLTYTIQVQNLGPDAASGVTVTDELPKGVDFVSATTTAGQCAQKGKKVSCALGTLGAPTVDYSGPPTVTLSVIPRQLGTIVNTASVKGDQKDPVAANNKATATTLVVGPAATCGGVAVTIAGTAGNDTLVGTGGSDVIAGFAGDDTVVSLGPGPGLRRHRQRPRRCRLRRRSRLRRRRQGRPARTRRSGCAEGRRRKRRPQGQPRRRSSARRRRPRPLSRRRRCGLDPGVRAIGPRSNATATGRECPAAVALCSVSGPLRAQSLSLVLKLLGVDHGPADTLDQLAGEMIRLQVGADDPLSIDDRVRGLGRVGDYEYLWHGDASSVGCRDSIAAVPWRQVKIG